MVGPAVVDERNGGRVDDGIVELVAQRLLGRTGMALSQPRDQRCHVNRSVADEVTLARSHDRALAFELSDPFNGLGLECLCISRDLDLALSLHVGHALVDRVDEFEQLTNESIARHRHLCLPCCCVCDRDTFHTSPHLVQRQ